MEFQREKERMLQNYLQTMKFLNDSTYEVLYLCDIKEQKIYFSCDVAEKYLLPPSEGAVYKLQELKDYVGSKSNEQIFFDTTAFGENGEKTLCQEYHITNMEGTKFWIQSREKMQCDENGKPMWIVGRISEENAEQKIEPLTGLPNISQLIADLQKCLENEKYGYLMVLGIDNFKNINNKNGRSYGNHVLKNIAEKLKEIVGEGLKVYRLDSDKFAINVIGLKKDEVVELYGKIQTGILIPCTLSSGAAYYAAGVTEEVDSIYQRAENALDRAKKNGKNNQEFFSEDIYEEQLDNFEFEEELKRSIRNDFEGFSICYQPQINGKTFELHGAEALLRYTSAERGAVSPAEFIPVLEQTRMIGMVGEWVLRNALKQCVEWRKVIPNFRMSVNFSYIQLRSKIIADHILRLLDELHLPGAALTLEVTESVQLQDYQFFNKIFYKLEKNGVGISIDDFGTGYSSLAYLKSIAISEVKIDRCFVTGIQHSAYNYRLLSNMMELAHSARVSVCCEGVETEEELRYLKRLNPDVLQGYLFDKPLTVEEFEGKYLNPDPQTGVKNKKRKQHYLALGADAVSNEKLQNLELEKLATIVDGMEEIVYVRDPETYDLFYLNDAGRVMTGAYDYRGRKCYEVLQNKKAPCEFCSQECISRDSYRVWELYNEHLQKHFLAKDKLLPWAGKDAYLAICIDVTEKEVTSQKIQQKLEFEQNIVAATTMLAVENDKSKAINETLRMIGEFYDANRAYLFELQDNKEFWDNTYEWCAEGVEPQIDFLQEVPISATQRWNDNFRKGESLITADIEDIRENSPEEYETLKAQNIKSLIASPIWHEDKVIGFVGVDDPKKYKLDATQVQTMAYFLADRLQKDDTRQRLGELLTFHSEDVLKTTKLGLWSIRISRDGRKNQLFADQTMLQIMGIKKPLTPEECYDYWYERIADGYFHYVSEAVAEMIETKKIVEMNYTWKHPVKGELTVRCIGRRVADNEGMICLEGYHRDLEDVKRTNSILLDTGIIFEYNENHQTIYFHSDRKTLFGDREREEKFPESWISQGMVHPHFVEKFKAVFIDVKGQPELEYQEFLLKTKNGDYDWFYLSTKDLSKEEQDADTMIVILEAASKERAVELQHMRLQDFYKATLSEKIAYMEVDLESRHVLEIGGLWNAYREEAMGEGSDYRDVMLRYKEDFIHPDDKLAYASFIGENLQDGMSVENNHTKKLQYRRLLDGRMQWVEITAHIFVEQYSENLYALLYLKNIDAQKRRQLAQEAAATRDYLTGVFNRRTFEYLVEEHMENAEEGVHSTLIVLDLDNFKHINDTFGHAEGDKILKELSHVLMSTFRRKDLLGRFGGDEFMIFLKNVSNREIIEKRIEEFCSTFANVNEHHSTCSIGIVEVRKEDFSFQKYLKKADHALYQSKERGKNTYTYYED